MLIRLYSSVTRQLVHNFEGFRIMAPKSKLLYTYLSMYMHVFCLFQSYCSNAFSFKVFVSSFTTFFGEVFVVMQQVEQQCSSLPFQQLCEFIWYFIEICANIHFFLLFFLFLRLLGRLLKVFDSQTLSLIQNEKTKSLARCSAAQFNDCYRFLYQILYLHLPLFSIQIFLCISNSLRNQMTETS